MRWMVLAVGLCACGGSVEMGEVYTGKVSAPAVPTVPTTTTTVTRPDAGHDAAPSCICAGAGNGSLLCDGVQASPADSCKACGGWCKCYVNGLAFDQACTAGEVCNVGGVDGVCQ